MNIPTAISLSRLLLAFLLFSESIAVRTFAILLAALTDFLDGFLARRLGQVTRLGTLMDPLADKLFVALALGLFCWEGKIELWQIALFLLRDVSLVAFSLYLWLNRAIRSWKIRSFLSGKLATTFQFIALLLLAQEHAIPASLWTLLGLAGLSSFFELFWLQKKQPLDAIKHEHKGAIT